MALGTEARKLQERWPLNAQYIQPCKRAHVCDIDETPVGTIDAELLDQAPIRRLLMSKVVNIPAGKV